MGLFDFFKKEKRSIEPTMNDWTSLLSIIQKEKNESVRIEAIKKLHHPLVDGSGNLSDICQINNQNLLKEIYFHNIYYQRLRVAVINQIKDQSILAEIAKTIFDNESVLRDTVLARLSEQTALTEVAMNARSVTMRKEVIKQILTDQSALNHIAKHNDNDEILKYAIRFILDENVLVELVDYYTSKNKSSEIQKSAKERLEQLRKEKNKSPKEIISGCLVGDRIAFGKWNGSPLYWNVLSVQNDRLLLITGEGLGYKAFHSTDKSPTWGDAPIIATWDSCSLRKELNGAYFYSNPDVFTTTERNYILLTKNETPGIYYQGEKTFKEVFGKDSLDTQDYVFLLSVQEACKYFNAQNVLRDVNFGKDAFIFPESEELICDGPGKEGNAPGQKWWLRTSSRNGEYAVAVNAFGRINYDGWEISTWSQVRPAIWIKKECL